MHFLSSSCYLALIVATLATIVSAWSTGLTGSKQIVLDDKLKVPGNNPLYYCEDPKDDIAKIAQVDLNPNPPQKGKKLLIAATGNLTEPIEQGAKVHLQVKYGLITLINQEADLCEQIDKVDLKCPLDKGERQLTKEAELPNQIPPGKYSVRADVYTEDKKKITCLTAEVHFH